MTDDLTETKAQDLGEQWEMGKKIIIGNMLESYNKKWKHLQPMVYSTKMATAREVLDDAFKVFSNMLENQSFGSEQIG